MQKSSEDEDRKKKLQSEALIDLHHGVQDMVTMLRYVLDQVVRDHIGSSAVIEVTIQAPGIEREPSVMFFVGLRGHDLKSWREVGRGETLEMALTDAKMGGCVNG